MIMTSAVRERLPEILSIFSRLPDGQHADVSNGSGGVRLDFICYSQKAAKAVRRLFPGTTWEKKYEAGTLNWWEYHGSWGGFELKIFGCSEAPPTCRMIEREEMVEAQVPVAFETRMVPKKIIEWKCDGEEAGHDA